MRVLYAQAVFGEEEIEAVIDVLRNRPLSLMDGESVAEFEGGVAKLFGKRHGLMVNSGSSANALALGALSLPAGSEIITPVLTFATTVSPIVQQGYVPAFVDVETGTYNVDAAHVERMINSRTRALMIPNLIGNLPDWRALRDIADRHSLMIIEDSADTIGSLIHSTPSGRLTDVSTTSFYASHVMTCAGFGGAACFGRDDLARRAKLLRGWGRASSVLKNSEDVESRFGSVVDGIEYDAKFVFEAIGYNFLPSEIAAAFGLVQLRRLPEYLARRKRNFQRLREFFSAYEEWFILPRQRAEVETAWLALPLTVRPGAPFSRREMQVFLEQNSIQTRTVFTGNILRQPGFAGINRREASGGYPNADAVMRGGLLLGCHQGMTEAQMDYMCERFREFANQH
ncbi:MAG: aminotransferase class I/II-fold pyridoxal phosphate-dependent enzyme [Gemmatimonadetes bacterium]|nr:aminotransferase class I/II-fold pyridoxal phosphate-dependent enzyme [Gemmatimonadota bacterium]